MEGRKGRRLSEKVKRGRQGFADKANYCWASCTDSVLVRGSRMIGRNTTKIGGRSEIER